MEKLVRQAGSAGKYYSKQMEILEREVAVLLENSPDMEKKNRIYGIIAPNDPHIICGGVSARAYRQVFDQDIETVVLITSSSHVYMEEITLFKGDAYSTPLGKISVDKKLITKFTEFHPNLVESTLGHESDEHGIEVQLPFLQHVLYEFKIVPVVMGNQDNENIEILSQALGTVLKNQKALIVASSNLSTSHPYDKAGMIDKVTQGLIEGFDDASLNNAFQAGEAEMSSGGAVIATIKACKNLGAKNSHVLLYRNSGDMGGNKSSVTGYLSAVLND